MRLDRKPSLLAGVLWWANCFGAGYVLGLKYGKPWHGLAVGGMAGIFPSIFAASPMVGGRGGCLPAPTGGLFGVALLLGGRLREGFAWGVAGVSVVFLVAVGVAGAVAVRMRRKQEDFERAVEQKDPGAIVAKWSQVRPTPAALAALSADSSSAALVQARYEGSKEPAERAKMIGLLSALRRPEARPFLLKLVQEKPARWEMALGGLILLGDPQDLPLIFSDLQLQDEQQSKAAIDLAAKHGARDLLAKLDVKDDRDLAAYRDAALSKLQ